MPLTRFHLDDDCADWILIRTMRSAALDVTAPWDADLYGAADEEHLAFAVTNQRVLITSNVRDFMRLHTVTVADRGSHPGMIFVVQQRYSRGEQARRILRIAASLNPAEMENRYEFLGDWSSGNIPT